MTRKAAVRARKRFNKWRRCASNVDGTAPDRWDLWCTYHTSLLYWFARGRS